ncbi:phosphate transport system regulatory protein PhoU [Spirochaetia bacterium]|nr:phosphate transport system regulatory protein PhoU [Spirochaetia bacterium]GHU31225.1 phosphate transport system regulatory protein PhoU [Spirochaetia bacterium]
MMRSRFDEQLTQLNNSLIEMGALIEQTIAKAVKALEEQDVESAQKIIEDDDIIDDKEKEIEGLCLKLLMNQQPVARDLRQVSTALKMITDMERIGDQAADISELCIHLARQKYIINLKHIPQMADATIKMVTDSIDAFVKKDLALAQAVIVSDNVVDDLFDIVKKEMIQLIHEDVQNGEQTVDLLQIAKYFERIGDHAVNIAEWVIFSITGRHKDTQVL